MHVFKHIHFADTNRSGQALANGGQGYFPADIRRLYNIPNDLTGAYQTIGIVEFSSGYSLQDATLFWKMHGITPPQVAFVSIDGTRNDGGMREDDEEASLDLQWAGAIAPGAQFVIYEANAGETYAEFEAAMLHALNYILNDNQYRPSVLSISYGDGEDSFDAGALQSMADIIQKLDERGVTVCIASGDQGAYGLHNPYGPYSRHADAPATSPHAVAVGGTHLYAHGGECAWTYLGPQHGGASGGGFSDIFPKPSWQTAVPGHARGVPDLALNADPDSGYQMVFQGQPTIVGGTSVACPVFAAMIALANERRASLGRKPLSSLPQVLYSYSSQLGFRDIVVGDNTYNGVIGYEAKPGWDAVTGFGSVDATTFIETLANDIP
ncbi:peptidase [Alicyclobacillus sacchari]|uniref:S53 family peptidase n=1 Tax=Alicyclobacillus sacchari TaxID=392010 RepID=UPI0023E9AE5E|nr:S53 family peptidase [Alicyclobacillus sacchari]GMA58424.1 peptidase [Alicyclobacillus sacchari]